MDEPRTDNVIRLVAKGSGGKSTQVTAPRPVSAETLQRERQQIIKLLEEVAQDHPAPISHVYKALAQMAKDAPLPADLRLDYPIGNGNGSVLMLANFTTQPGNVKTTVHVGNFEAERDHESIPYLGRDRVETTFKGLAPEFTVYQVFSLRQSFVLVNSLMGFGLNLAYIQNEPQRTVFGFTYRSPQGVYPITVTVHIPLWD